MKKIIFIILLLTATFISGCGTKAPQKLDQSASKTLLVFTTIFPIEDFTKKIGGQHVEVKSVYPAGADAHTFEPTMRAMMDIADADLFIYNGSGLEPFIDKTKKSIANEKVTIIEASKGIELLSRNDEADHDSDDHHHDKDPHLWLDPINAIKMAENIKVALTEAMPSAKDDFEKNFQDVKHELEQLDQELQKTVKEAAHKEILVSHASYGYWEHRYGLEQISISGLSPENEPSQKQLQTIIETAKAHHIYYIIYDQNPVTKVAGVVKKETGTTPVTLHNLEYITKNDLMNNDDYFSIMNKNIETLKKVLAE